MKTVVVALGGNALLRPRERGTVKGQLKHVNETISNIKKLFRKYRVVITHGNAPQVGGLLIQQEISKKKIPPMPLDVLDAMTQGQLGYLIQRSLDEKLKVRAVTVITQILVDKNDKAFKKPTKPIGPYYKNKVERNMIREPEGWRKVVASPRPIKIIEIEEIMSLIKAGFTVIACGGGGIPVIKEEEMLKGVEAVIDKDYATEKLAEQIKANIMIFLTDVDYVYLDYESRRRTPIREMNSKEAQKYMKHFKEGSMRPKIEAAVEFLKKGGEKVIITSPKLLDKALKGKSGTVIR